MPKGEHISGLEGKAASSKVSSSAEASSAVHKGGVLPHISNLQIILFIAAILLAAAVVAYILYLIHKRKSSPADKKSEVIRSVPTTVRMDERSRPATGRVYGGNSQNIGKRENQQDSFAVSDFGNDAVCKANGIFAVVADGMGGLENGAEISSLVVSTMLTFFESHSGGLEPAGKLREMLLLANEKVNRYLSSQGNIQSGSTVVSVIIHNGALHFIAVGDSHIYLFRKNRLWLLNVPHNLGSELDEKVLRGELTREEAQSNKERGALTSYIGIGELELIDANIKPIALCAGDKILLCTDGVFGTISENEIIEAMHYPPNQAAEEIERLVMQKDKKYQDNMTAVVLECE